MYLEITLPILSGVICQLLKIFIKQNNKGFNLKDLFSYSGMPSSHTAIVVSLALIIALDYGMHNPLFAISLIFAFIVIRDALGLRRYLGEHGRVLNVLVKDLKEDDFLDKKYPHLLEKIGHTPMQVLVGGIIGCIITTLGWILF